MAKQTRLTAGGYLTSAYINPPGPGNAYVGGNRRVNIGTFAVEDNVGHAAQHTA
jgi:hypothetical protein